MDGMEGVRLTRLKKENKLHKLSDAHMVHSKFLAWKIVVKVRIRSSYCSVLIGIVALFLLMLFSKNILKVGCEVGIYYVHCRAP